MSLHDDPWYRQRLAPPTGRVRVVIDTDTANEIDDQFALAWALRCPQQLDLVAVYAAPFSFAHRRHLYPAAPADAAPFNPPDVGMERSFQEAVRVFELLGLSPAGKVFRGSTAYLPGPRQALRSDAVDHLISTARQHAPGGAPLYVLALGCVTNIASALLLAPDIAERIVVVWTSAYPSHAPHANLSFNLEQDLGASRWLLDSGVPHVYLPGFHVGAQLRLSLPEIEGHVRGRGAIGNYLHHLFTHNPLWQMLGLDADQVNARPHSWVIWDIICVAWLINPDWVPDSLVRTPLLGEDCRWHAADGRHLMREAHGVQRDPIFHALFDALPPSG